MRVFIGIRLDQAAREKITEALKPFKRFSTPIKWVKPENWHLTLKFIGDVDNERSDQILGAIKKIRFESDPIELEFSGFGKFGRDNNLNIFWVGIERNESLSRIHSLIENGLSQIGFKKENRPFSPHLTLGRNRKSFHSAPFFALIEKNQSLPICRFRSEGFQVFESVLTPEGPIYTILEEINFVPK